MNEAAAILVLSALRGFDPSWSSPLLTPMVSSRIQNWGEVHSFDGAS